MSLASAHRAWLARAGAFVGAVVLVVSIPAVRSWANRSDRFVASSHVPGYPKEGYLTDQGAYGLLFHTHVEAEPHVLIDLGSERPIEEIEVTNRVDCCQDRALPLSVEVAGADEVFSEVAKRDEPFEVWTISLPEKRPALWVRITARKKTILHLHAIRVR